MQSQLKVTFLGLTCVLMIGCIIPHPGRESAFAVKGKIIIPAEYNEAPANCNLQLFRSGPDRKVQEISVALNFERSFVIAPGVHEYYMVVRCPGGWVHKTGAYKLGSNRYLLNPVDLGEIGLTRSTD